MENSSNSNFKKCPYCQETIKAKAVFCRYCRHDLTAPLPEWAKAENKIEEDTTQPEQPETSDDTPSSQGTSTPLENPSKPPVSFFNRYKKPILIGIGLIVVLILIITAFIIYQKQKKISMEEFKSLAPAAIENTLDTTYGKPDSTGCRNLSHSDGNRYCMKIDEVEYVDATLGNDTAKRVYVTVRSASNSYSAKNDLLGLMVFEWNPSEKRVQMVSGVKDLVIGHDSQFEQSSLPETYNNVSSSRLIHFGKGLYGWVLHDVPENGRWGALKVYSPLNGSTIKEILNVREGSVPPAHAIGENSTACASAPCYPAPQITGLKAEIRAIESPKEEFYPIELTYTIQSSGGSPSAPAATKKTVMLSFDKSLGSYVIPEEIKSIGNRSAYDGEDAPAASAPAASAPDPSAAPYAPAASAAAPASYYSYGSEFEGEYHTSRHSIRITKRNGRYLYQAWKQPKTMDEGPPDLMLTNGEDSTDGITFKKGNLVIDINRSNTADKELYIFINNVYRDHYYMYRN